MMQRTRGSGSISLLLVAVIFGCGGGEPPSSIATDEIDVVWRAPLASAPQSSPSFHGPAIDGDRFYFLWRGITALRRDSGTHEWVAEGLSVGSENVVARDGRVFESADAARALDGASGSEIWRFVPETPADFAHSTVDDRAFYIGARSSRIYALDMVTGDSLWATDPLSEIQYEAMAQSLAVSGDTVYAAVVDDTSPTGHLKRGWIVALDRYDGRVLWRYVNEVAGEAHDVGWQVVAGRMLLVNDYRGGAIIGLDRFTGEEVWRYIGPLDRYGARDFFEVVDGVAYVASGDTHVYAFDPETGEIHWRTPLGASAGSSTVCGDYLFVDVGSLHMLRRSDGQEIANLFLDWDGTVGEEWVSSRLLSHEGRVYFAGNEAAYAVGCEPVPGEVEESGAARLTGPTEPAWRR